MLTLCTRTSARHLSSSISRFNASHPAGTTTGTSTAEDAAGAAAADRNDDEPELGALRFDGLRGADPPVGVALEAGTGEFLIDPPSIAIRLATSELGLRGEVLPALGSLAEWRLGRGGEAVMLGPAEWALLDPFEWPRSE